MNTAYRDLLIELYLWDEGDEEEGPTDLPVVSVGGAGTGHADEMAVVRQESPVLKS